MILTELTVSLLGEKQTAKQSVQCYTNCVCMSIYDWNPSWPLLLTEHLQWREHATPVLCHQSWAPQTWLARWWGLKAQLHVIEISVCASVCMWGQRTALESHLLTSPSLRQCLSCCVFHWAAYSTLADLWVSGHTSFSISHLQVRKLGIPDASHCI